MQHLFSILSNAAPLDDPPASPTEEFKYAQRLEDQSAVSKGPERCSNRTRNCRLLSFLAFPYRLVNKNEHERKRRINMVTTSTHIRGFWPATMADLQHATH